MPSARLLLGYVKPLYIYCFIVNLLGFGREIVAGFIRWNTWSTLVEMLIFQIVGVLLFGFLASRIGRKKSLILAGIFIFISQIADFLSQITRYIIKPFNGENYICALTVKQITRDLGISGINLISPMYIGEIAEDHNRGVLVSSFILSLELGRLLFMKFTFFRNFPGFYYGVRYGAFFFFLVIIVICLVLLLWLPESPVYYLLNKKTEDAKTALVKLRGKDNQITEREFNELILSVEKSNSNKKTIPFMSLITDSGFRKGLILGWVIMNATQLNKGVEKVVDKISELGYFGSFFPHHYMDLTDFIALLKVSGLIVAMAFIERSGRRFLLLVSCGGTAMIFIFYYLFSALFFLELKWEYDIFAKDSLIWIFYIFRFVFFTMYYLGCRVVPWVLLSELFATDSRVSGITFCNLFIYIGDYIWKRTNALWFYHSSWNYGIDFVFPSVFFIIAISCWLVAYYFLPETKGKSLEEISETLAEGFII